MNERTLLKVGIGTGIAALCCSTPILVVPLGARSFSAPVGRPRLSPAARARGLVALIIYGLVKEPGRSRGSGDSEACPSCGRLQPKAGDRCVLCRAGPCPPVQEAKRQSRPAEEAAPKIIRLS